MSINAAIASGDFAAYEALLDGLTDKELEQEVAAPGSSEFVYDSKWTF